MSSSATGRKLFGTPVLLQDWDQEAEEGAAQYWELFLDLLLVAAASSIADEFKEHLTVQGFFNFAVMYLIIVNGWLLYTHHITSRFQDTSLAHSLVLFVYLLGFGACIVNAGLDDAPAFALGAILMRISVLVMLVSVVLCIPRARYFCGVLCGVIVLTLLGLTLVVVFPSNPTVVQAGLWFAAGVEFLAELFMVHIMQGRRLLPINIDQSKERLGALVLIMLGETVLSVTITYREVKHEHVQEEAEQESPTAETDTDIHQTTYYYWVLGLSFLLIYMFTLLFFHMQPSPHEHAFRRSRTHGTLLLLAHKILGLALLTVGVSVKLVVEAVMTDEDSNVDEQESSTITNDSTDITPFGCRLMGLGVGASLVMLLCIRYLHYGNKPEFQLGDKMVVIGKDAKVDRLTNLWWWTFGLACIVPFACLPLTMRHALFATAFYAGLVFSLVILETTYTHLIGKRLHAIDDDDEVKGEHRGGEAAEELILDSETPAAVASYQQATRS